MVAEPWLETPDVVTVNVAVSALAATVTEAGTCATDVLPLVSDTDAPPAGAWALKVTVAVEELPPRTATGLKVSESIVVAAVVMLSVAD